MLTLFAGREEPVERFEELDTERYGELFRGLLERGIYVAPSQYECLFPSLAHGDDEIDATIEAVVMSSVADAIVAGARAESEVWARALRRPPDWEPVFSPLAPDGLALGLETVYEAYLVHYGRPRLFDAPDADEAVLLGDYLYAHGLVRIAEAGGVDAVAVMAELISRCAALRADGAQRRRRRVGRRDARARRGPGRRRRRARARTALR